MKKIVIKLIVFSMLLSYVCFPNITAYADELGLDIYENGMTKEEYYQQTIDQYAQFDYSDPNTTTDEELFGKWSSDEWEIEPLLDYERYDALSEVEEAAKNANGNYEECKRLILDYYKDKFDTFNIGNPATKYYSNSRYKLAVEMNMDNFAVRPEMGPYPLSKMLVEKGEENATWYQSTVLDSVTNVVGATERRVTLHVYALKKDGYTVKFDSREGENKPFIRITVNGVTRDYYPVADTYISGGDNQYVNFGEEQQLLVEESFTSINETARSDAYSRRALLKFDFSDLNPTDKVTTATLNLYGYMEKSDNPVDSGVEKASKIVFVMNDTTNQDWVETSVKWEILDDCGYVDFSFDGIAGYPKENMKVYFPTLDKYLGTVTNFGNDISMFARYYAASNDEAVAYHTLRLVMQKIRNVNGELASMDQPTLGATRASDLIEIFYRCRHSEYMTPEIFTTMLKFIYEHGEGIVGSEKYADVRSKIWSPALKTGNIGALQTRALFLTGIVFNEFKAANEPLGEEWAEDSFDGGWLAVADNRFNICLDYSVNPDGSTTDIPIHYIWTNLSNYVNILTSYPVTYNFNLEDVMDSSFDDIILRAGEYVANILNPIYGEWQCGDGRKYTTKGNSELKNLYNAYPNDVSEHFIYIATEGKLGKPAEYTSFVGDYTNTAVLRSGWDQDAVSLKIQASSNFQHTHDDDLGIILMAYGNYLLADLNRYTYAATPMAVWQQSRDAHNSIVVDNANSAESGGSMNPDDRELNNIYDYLHVDSNGYENQFQERYVLFVRPGYYIVTDHIDSKDEDTHNYRQNWHFQPDANISINEYGQTKTNYATAANLTVVPIAKNGELKKEILTGHYSHNSQSQEVEPNQYVVYSKDVSGDTSYQTILYPTAKGRNVDIHTEVLEASIPAPDARAMRASMSENGFNYITDYYILLNKDAKAEVTYGNYKTDGSMSFTEYTDEKISTIILRNGTYIEDATTGKKIIAMSSETEDIGVSFEYDKVVIESSKDATDIGGMVVYVGENQISTAEFNGQSVPFTKEGKYIFFGSSPVVDIPDEEDDSSYVPKGDSPSGGMSGSGGGSSKKEADNEADEEPKENSEEKPKEENKEENAEKPSNAFAEELENYWGKTEIAEMVDLKYVNGSDGKLNLQNSITRAEFIAVVMRVLGVEAEPYKGLFNDVSENDWYAPYIETAYSEELISGYENMANPQDYITREQIAKILVNAYEKKKGAYSIENGINFTDISAASGWANEFISKCSEIGLMNGYVDGTFKPTANITRGEAFVTLYRLLNLINE